MKRAELTPEGDRFQPVESYKSFDSNLNLLLGNYIGVVEMTALVPWLSIWGYFEFYAKFIRWYFATIFVWPILLVNFGIRIYYRQAQPPSKKFGWEVVDWACSPFISMHAGDLSGAKFLVLRGAVRLMIYYRFRGVLNSIILKLQEAEIAGFTNARLLASDVVWYEQRIAIVRNLREAIGERLGYSLLTSLASVAGVFGVTKTVYEILPEEAKKIF